MLNPESQQVESSPMAAGVSDSLSEGANGKQPLELVKNAKRA